MKKYLFLFVVLVVLFPFTSYAGFDPETYWDYGDFTCTNKWLTSRSVDEAEWGYKFLEFNYSKQRTATIFGDNNNLKVIIGYSEPTETLVDGSTITIDHANICIFDLQTGIFEQQVKLTCKGEPITGLLCANQIGTDSYGNLWIAGFRSGSDPVKVYTIDNINTGECSLVAQISLAINAQLDHYDIIGDVTGKNSHCIIMSSARTGLIVFRWKREKGENEWKNDLTLRLTTTYPELTDSNNGVSMISIIDNKSHDGENFIFDSFSTYPVKYNLNAEMIDGFFDVESVNFDYFPSQYTNGAIEFSIGNKIFVAYSLGLPNQSGKNPGCMAIADISYSFYGVEPCWKLTSLGFESDGGTRMHCIDAKKVSDINGYEGVYLLNYKSNNGIGVYLIAEKYFNEALISGIDNNCFEAVNAENACYDIYGRLLNEPTKGLNIVKYSDGTIRKEYVK